ncbi:hypothetical protein P691DRAFT_138238 [Macrolepiota fuliginosa MF-IS2]|uniref:Uncharacterized protein n=1 Tax=Macrolepiota fuliginosa MF-IS2 TaxID=1400762 RepID=A0A9P6C109_9AGAR|nr:hypothetical protein P691DRAFT_138238 [Macrolepiota fuliginosa MF-IS2]
MSSHTVPTIAINGSPLHASRPRNMPSPTHQLLPASQTPLHDTWIPREKQPYDFTFAEYEYNNVVYHYRGHNALVRVSPTYEGAIDLAVEEFPRLKSVPREDIVICYNTFSNGGSTDWRISASSWENSVKRFGPRTLFAIAVKGEDRIAGPCSVPKGADALPPPPYEPCPEMIARSRARARSHSPGRLKTPSIVVPKKRSSGTLGSFFKWL